VAKYVVVLVAFNFFVSAPLGDLFAQWDISSVALCVVSTFLLLALFGIGVSLARVFQRQFGRRGARRALAGFIIFWCMVCCVVVWLDWSLITVTETLSITGLVALGGAELFCELSWRRMKAVGAGNAAGHDGGKD